MFAVALCREMLELYEVKSVLWAVMLPAIIHFIREFFYTGNTFFSQSAVFIFVSQHTLLLPLVVSNQLIRKVVQI
jgi:hypothetical protein